MTEQEKRKNEQDVATVKRDMDTNTALIGISCVGIAAMIAVAAVAIMGRPNNVSHYVDIKYEMPEDNYW